MHDILWVSRSLARVKAWLGPGKFGPNWLSGRKVQHHTSSIRGFELLYVHQMTCRQGDRPLGRSSFIFYFNTLNDRAILLLLLPVSHL